MITILLVDDQNLVQQGIKSLLDGDPEIKVIGTVKNGRSAVKQVTELRPDIVLLDIEMPDMDGITATKYITHLVPHTKVIILSSHEENKYVTRALMAGAKSYILKTSLIADLRQSIVAVNSGYTQIESRLLSKIFDSSRIKQRRKKSQRQSNLPNNSKSPVEPISKSEKSVLVNKAAQSNNAEQMLAKDEVSSKSANYLISEPSEEKISSSDRSAAAPVARIDLLHKIDDYPTASHDNQNDENTAKVAPKSENKLLPATYLTKTNDSSQLSIVPIGASKKTFFATSEDQKYLPQLRELLIVEKSRGILTQWWSDSKTFYAPIWEKCRIQLAKYKSASQARLLPTFKHWREKGWLANLGLVLLGLVLVIVIHSVFF